MKVTETYLEGCFVLEPKIFGDGRGFFFESFNQKVFEEKTGLKVQFLQDNQSISQKGVLRGLHIQKGEFAQAKLVRVIQGEVLDVAVAVPNPTDVSNILAVSYPEKITSNYLFQKDSCMVFLFLKTTLYSPINAIIIIDDLCLKWVIPFSSIALLKEEEIDGQKYILYERPESRIKIKDILPKIIEESINKVEEQKKMRWSSVDISFIRPIRWILLMLDNKHLPATILGVATNNYTYLLVMIGGMATVAGGVLAAYIGFLGGDDEVLRLFYAKHLLTASVMAAPGAIVISKMLYPQVEAIDNAIEKMIASQNKRK